MNPNNIAPQQLQDLEMMQYRQYFNQVTDPVFMYQMYQLDKQREIQMLLSNYEASNDQVPGEWGVQSRQGVPSQYW